ncbi:MAG: helix-turn-helix domain-containing protein [Gammaproteobacteria bacterium]
MRQTEARQGVRMIKFLSILSRCEAAEFSQVEAAELLGIGERTFRRWRQRFGAAIIFTRPRLAARLTGRA